jgi:ribosomal protein S27E
MTDPNNPQNGSPPISTNPPTHQKKFLAFSAACPSCGAQVSFHSTASVMAICEYCQTTVLRDENTIRDQGKMSAILEDYSPLQIGSSGFLDGLGFALIGRIQLQYTDGFWNEWYLQFDDGTNGWLSDASGLYVLTRHTGTLPDAPQFGALSINQIVVYKSASYRVTDHRTASCTGGQGELPFVVGSGWQTSVADLRVQARFMSLDYSDGYPPQIYEGRAVTLSGLKFQLLRDVDQIQSASGKVKGKITNLECPNCGSPIPYVMGMAEHLACPACRAEVAISGDKAQLLVKHKELTTLKTALSLGDKATFDDHAYIVIGLMQVEEVSEDVSGLWTEYLLYSLEAGFLWLVDGGEEHWQKTIVLNEIPEEKAGNAYFQEKRWERKWAYQGRVLYAVGAFNWRVKVGDTNFIIEYTNASDTLVSERNQNEINWSLSTPISGFFIRQAFGKKQPSREAAIDVTPNGHTGVVKWLSILLWTINLPIILAGNGSFFLTLIAQFAILFLPAIMERTDSENITLNETFGKNASLWAWGLGIVVLTMFINVSSENSSSNWRSSRGPGGFVGGYGGGWSSGGGHK